jgi:hypothetical protein
MIKSGDPVTDPKSGISTPLINLGRAIALSGGPPVGGPSRPPAEPDPAQGATWNELVKLVNSASHRIDITTNKPRYRVGDRLVITCRVDREGYLNILNLAPGERRPTVLFPNQFHPTNKVRAGQTITIPAQQDDFTLQAQPPKGKSLLVVFHTKKNVNAYKDGLGDSADLFKTLSREWTQVFVDQQEKGGKYLGAGKIVTVVE